MVYCYLFVFFYLSKLLFSGFLPFKGYFVRGRKKKKKHRGHPGFHGEEPLCSLNFSYTKALEIFSTFHTFYNRQSIKR